MLDCNKDMTGDLLAMSTGKFSVHRELHRLLIGLGNNYHVALCLWGRPDLECPVNNMFLEIKGVGPPAVVSLCN